eukprot:TRINITY_DN39361_c0_g1_i1.p1 TRINITY_DN39361_c0_g1~~TRINITY_DN39361_c0_g1_i1.p1  ORF type:complete len:1041 (+),score=243.81 TRINITY_DN39361_c0_g1_i1:366-3488(+)
MTGSMTSEVDTVSSTIIAMLTESVWFVLGFLIFKAAVRFGFFAKAKVTKPEEGHPKSTKGGKSTKEKPATPKEHPRSAAAKAICEAALAGQWKDVLDSWYHEKDLALDSPLPVDAVQAVAQALVKLEPEKFSSEIVDYVSRHNQIARSAHLYSLMDIAMHSDRPMLAAELAEAAAAANITAGFGQEPRTLELILTSIAITGDESKIKEKLSEASNDSNDANLHSAAIRGFLKGNHLMLAVKYAHEMHVKGLTIPNKALHSIFRTACALEDQGATCTKVLDVIADVPLPSEAAAVILAGCIDRDDVKMALKLEKRLHLQQTPFTYAILEPLLKIMAKTDEYHAIQLLQEMQDQKLHLSEGLCGYIISRCGDANHLKLVDHVIKYLESRKMMSLAIYKTLMKVYVTNDLYEEACDLYSKLKADGLEPDRVMYVCLVKFAAKCGRHDLSAELCMKQQGQPGSVQNSMWLIRAASKDGDIDQVLRILANLKATTPPGNTVDGTVYNSVLDACLSHGKQKEAEELMKEMVDQKIATLVTYNTMMKGLCSAGQFSRAQGLLSEMAKQGLAADCASYNCLISSAIASNDFGAAWGVFDAMEAKGLQADHYTISILMKAARKSKKASDADRAMQLLDRSNVHACSDEVLLNTVIDACIHRKDYKRLRRILSDFERQTEARAKMTVQSCGLIIKAYSCLRMVHKCWDQWIEMTQTRGLIPSDVAFSCMLDALICAGEVNSAVELFGKWRPVVTPNMVIFSTLIKGFASQGNAKQAMEIFREVRSLGLTMNLVAYSALIDAHARVGETEEARAILKEMDRDGIAPNIITYSSLVKGYCRRGNLDGALQAFAEMLSRGLQADTVIFNTLLDGAVRADRFELCDQLLSEMRESYKLQASNFTLSIMVKMWGKRRNLDMAFQVVYAAMKDGHQRLDSQICSCVVSACLHNRDAQRAIQVIQEMKTWPNCDGPDAGTYGMLITGLLNCDRIKEAAAAAEEAIELSTGPRASLYPLKDDVVRQLKKKLESRGFADLWRSMEHKLPSSSFRHSQWS